MKTRDRDREFFDGAVVALASITCPPERLMAACVEVSKAGHAGGSDHAHALTAELLVKRIQARRQS